MTPLTRFELHPVPLFHSELAQRQPPLASFGSRRPAGDVGFVKFGNFDCERPGLSVAHYVNGDLRSNLRVGDQQRQVGVSFTVWPS